MKLTNKLGLPESIVNAVRNDPYTKGDSDITVTQLIKPPQMVQLERQFADEIEEDVSDRIWALFGSAAHEIMERGVGEGDISEKRIFADINGVRVSGQFDLLKADNTLIDFKTTSVWSVIDAQKNGKKEWEEQLNLLAALVRRSNYKNPESLEIIAICRDWRQSESVRNPDYPDKVAVIQIPMWDDEVASNYLVERVNLHMASPQPCTDEERWYSGDSWAVMKKGRKSALRVLHSESEAEQWKAENGGDEIVFRQGEYKRCQQYCSVAKFCKQFNG